MVVKDNIFNDIETKAQLMNILKQRKQLETIQGIRCFYLQHIDTHSYTYVVLNDQDYPIQCQLDSKNMLFSSGNPIINWRL